MKAVIERHSEIVRSPRVMQLQGLFDVPPAERSGERWDVTLPIEVHPWNVGLIVGPSGCGKSTIAHELFGGAVCHGFDWPAHASIIDAFPATMGIKDITGLLSSVGFSSPPLWLRPYGVLSTGQQMRVTIARLLAEQPQLAVMDEFTSVVDRTVAQVGSAAIAKTVRRRKQQFVAVTCHADVTDWLQPDWVYQPDSGAFAWRELQRRPPIDLDIARVHHSAWQQFKAYHYLDASLHRSARCFVAFYRDEPVAFAGILPVPGITGRSRISRIVTNPDYQGIGVGLALMDEMGALYRALNRTLVITTGLAQLAAALGRNPNWTLLRKAALGKRLGRTSHVAGIQPATTRITSGWHYTGPKMARLEAAALMGVPT